MGETKELSFLDTRLEQYELTETGAACAALSQMGSRTERGSRHKHPSKTQKLAQYMIACKGKSILPSRVSVDIHTILKGRSHVQP